MMKRVHPKCVVMLLVMAIVFVPAWKAVKAEPGAQIVSLQFSRTDIQTVLGALATQVGFNLVVGPDVKGDIDVHLADVDWRVALNTIVAANGYSYFWNDNVLVVLPAAQDAPEGVVHRVVKLRYADPLAVKGVLASVLSPRGKVEMVGTAAASGANTTSRPVLVLTESPQLIPGLLSIVDSLDVPIPQFEIGVKFIETDIDNRLGVGINWPTTLTATVAKKNTTTSTTQSVSTPAAEYPIPAGKIWKFGTLSIDQFTGVLDMLQQNGTSRLLSDPRVTVLENQKATIKVTTTIPVQTLNRFTEGAVIQDIVNFQDLDVGITLTVVPRLNDSSQITLEVEPVVEEITGFTGPPENERPITAKRTVKTTVRVADGATLVIGGLVRETKLDKRNKVFLLGDIPFLGALFTHKTVETKKTDLLIFITPHILSAAG